MAQAVETTIEINGVKIKQFASLKLSQGIYAHHSFRLVCPAEAVEEGGGAIFKESKCLIGAPVHIKVMSEPERSELEFTGVVTQMEAICNNGHPGSVEISGYSPTILLDSGPHCRSWLRKSVKSIVRDVLKLYPGEMLKYKINPTFKETLYYYVQYKETAWRFISRLAGKHGEWLFYDGQKLVLGPPKGKKITLKYGVQLSRYAVHMQIKPGKFQVMAFDYVGNEVFNSEVAHSALNAGHNGLGEYALTKGEQLLSVQAVNWDNHYVRNKKQVDDTMSIRAAGEISDVVRVNGCSDLPGFQPGDNVSIKVDEAKDPADRSLGEFTIVSVEHNWDGIGNYSNEFMGIPALVKAPPVKAEAEPYCEMQSARVVDNYDEARLGRVQVRFHWMSKTEKSPWLRVVAPYAGDGKGLYMIPEKEEEVIVAFAGDNAVRPYVVGTVYNGGAKCGIDNTGNDIKAIQTRNGIKLIMNDKDGSVSMEDKNGNKLMMDGEKNIVIEAIGNLKLKCGEAELEMKDGMIMLTGAKVNIRTTEEIKIVSDANANISSAVDLVMEAGMIKLN
jgi:type VI secretion system secreted protein VgrG